MAQWRQGTDGSFYLGAQSSEEYGGYVVRVDSDPHPEKWFAYEWVAPESKHVWVGEAASAEIAQTAVKGEFLCEVYRVREGSHCPYPGVVVRTEIPKAVRVRTILCGEHSGLWKGWESIRIEEYRTQYGLIPDEPIIGERGTPSLDLPTLREGALKAVTATERNMWIALSRVVRPLAELQYWRGHFARYPLDLNARPRMDAYSEWTRALEHAEGMYAIYMREDHGQENATLPNDLLRIIEREAVEMLRERKRGGK
ncbi:hypothetical protein [Streptomyces sp. 4F14]|uniref:hypothetical protein n=1 Tax=Streptomyces sp. 4F14 TaxID=3394380 RepID=UPI003A892269